MGRIRRVLADYHMHLRTSRTDYEEIDHRVEAVEPYVERAAALGVAEIGFSEHVYYFRQTDGIWDQPYHVERCVHDLDRYVDAVLEAKRRELPVKLGLEVDWAPGREEALAAALEPYPWDYLLGSVHFVDGHPVDAPPGLAAVLGVESAWERYTEWLSDLARSGLVDVLAHPDLVKIFGDRLEWDWGVLVDALDGVRLEVSSAGLHKPVGELYPERALLERARAAGVGITLASDAHLPQHAGRDLDRAVEHARAAGYQTLTVFDRRVPREEPLG